MNICYCGVLNHKLGLDWCWWIQCLSSHYFLIGSTNWRNWLTMSWRRQIMENSKHQRICCFFVMQQPNERALKLGLSASRRKLAKNRLNISPVLKWNQRGTKSKIKDKMPNAMKKGSKQIGPNSIILFKQMVPDYLRTSKFMIQRLHKLDYAYHWHT